MKNKKFLNAKVEVKRSGDVITVVASDETLDRHGDVLPIEAWDLTKFKMAPRMLVDHDNSVSSIVGKWTNIRIEGKQLLMDAVFHEITDLAKEVKQMVMEKFLDTVSVGFIWKGPEKNGDRPSFELVETSWVSVPANPSARVQTSLKSAMEAVLTPEQEKDIKEFAELENSDEILEEEDQDEVVEGEVEEEVVPEEVVEDPEEKAVDTAEDLIEFVDKNADAKNVLCSIIFVSKLISDSEQLKKLTQEAEARKTANQKAKLVQMALKEAASHISHSLRELNRVEN